MNPPEKPKKSRFAVGLRAVLISLVFVFLLFGCQSCVTTGYAFSLTSSITYQDISSEEALTAFYNELYAMVADKTELILFISNLLTVLITCLFFRLRGKNPRTEVSCYKVNVLRTPSFVLFGCALNFFVSLTISIVPFPDTWIENFNSAYAEISVFSNPLDLIFTLLSVGLVTGITEEIVFRGVSLKLLVPALGKIPSVIITALIFGLAHGTPIAMCYSFVIGLIFGALDIAYGSVIPSIICHVFFNLSSYILSSVPESSGMFGALYVISAALLILLTYRIFIRHPVFSDVVADSDNRIEPINEREKEIVASLKELQNRLDSDDVENIVDDWEELKQKKIDLAEEWTKNRIDAKQNKHNKK